MNEAHLKKASQIVGDFLKRAEVPGRNEKLVIEIAEALNSAHEAGRKYESDELRKRHADAIVKAVQDIVPSGKVG